MVAVIVTTWNDATDIRAGYLDQTLWSLRTHLVAPGDVDLIVADDGSDDLGHTRALAVKYGAKFVTGVHDGIGSSLWRGINAAADGQYIMYTTDDWKLTGELDLTQAVTLAEGYDVVRVGPPHPNLLGIIQFQQHLGWWLHISTPQSGYPFGTRPFVARKGLFGRLGPPPAAVDSYVFENWFNEACQRPEIAATLACVTLHGPWEHIGEYEVGKLPIV